MKGGSTIIVDVYLEQINENTFEPTNNLLLFILHEINIQSMTKFVTKKDYKSSKTTDNTTKAHLVTLHVLYGKVK